MVFAYIKIRPKKTILAGAIALTLAAATNASAAIFDITITNMDFGGVSAADGDFTENGGFIYMPFNNLTAMATSTVVFDTDGVNNWSDVGGVTFNGTEYADVYDDAVWINSFNYDFNLAAGEVAIGLSFDWDINYDIPLLAIFSCDAGVCQGVSEPMAVGPFPDQAPIFNGTGSIATPVPAAVWLFGSGLIGLAGFARRKKA